MNNKTKEIYLNQISFLEEFGFSKKKTTDGVRFTKKSGSGFVCIKFKTITASNEAYCSVSFRINDIENILNFYKIKHKVFNPKFAKQTPTISLSLNRLLSDNLSIVIDDNIEQQIKPIFKETIKPFLDSFANKEGALIIIQNEDWIQYVEPAKSLYELVITYVNEAPLDKVKNQIKNLNQNSMVKMYTPIFEDILKTIEGNHKLEALN